MTILELPCDGETHRIEILEDGTAVMLDHDEEMVRAFIAFNAAEPSCFVVQQRINDAEAAYRAAMERWDVAGQIVTPETKAAMRETNAEMQEARRMVLQGQFSELALWIARYRRLLGEYLPTSIQWRRYVAKLLMLQDVADVFEARVESAAP
jgi:hypothetical protein